MYLLCIQLVYTVLISKGCSEIYLHPWFCSALQLLMGFQRVSEGRHQRREDCFWFRCPLLLRLPMHHSEVDRSWRWLLVPRRVICHRGWMWSSDWCIVEHLLTMWSSDWCIVEHLFNLCQFFSFICIIFLFLKLLKLTIASINFFN